MSDKEHVIRIEGGTASFVYSDALAPLLEQGQATVTRASHGEPHPTRPGWLVDMRPSGGTVFGKDGPLTGSYLWRETPGENPLMRYRDLEPFALRDDALAAEREWLRKEKGL